MSEYMIYNAVPAYKEAPVSFDLLKEKAPLILENIASANHQKNYIVVDKNGKEAVIKLEDALKAYPNLDLEILSVEPCSRFVYMNMSAVEKVIEGEKAIPFKKGSGLTLCSVEQILGMEEKQVYIDGNVIKKGRYKFPKIIKVEDILEVCGSKEDFKAVYFGYPMGVFFGEKNMETEVELTTDYLCIFDKTSCMLDKMIQIMIGYTMESCGRCVFGHEGVGQIHMILLDISQKKGRSEDIDLLLDLCEEMQNQALCEIGEYAAKTVVSALDSFREEIEKHITKKACEAAVCSKFITYHILPDLCTGCGECQEECDEDAILGKKRFIHVIDQDECISCGNCLEVCSEEAIVKAGAIKPRCPKKPVPCKRNH